MHLTRCHDQSRRSLEEFYREFAESPDEVSRAIGHTMLRLIGRLQALPDNRQVYGLTSHACLWLHAQNSGETSGFVSIGVLDPKHYFIEYLMPEHVAPWDKAYVKGEARSEDEAIKMILKAMEMSDG